MKAFVMDAFTTELFGGNQAGVVLLEDTVSDELMLKIAAEFKHSETAFIRQESDKSFTVRYFTPLNEVELCGHATIASFALLKQLGIINDGDVLARTAAGDINVSISGNDVLINMAPPKLIKELSADDADELYKAYGLTASEGITGLSPAVVSCGLKDIMMPVKDHETLMKAKQNESVISELSKKHDCVGVHMFTPGTEFTAHCSNFAPLYGIREECATGTSNAALTYYLYLHDLIMPGQTNVFLQGEHMNRPCRIKSRLSERNGDVKVLIGGSAVMSMECDIKL